MGMGGNYELMDVHGAGAQRSDPKVGNPDDYPYGHGPQGDVIRIVGGDVDFEQPVDSMEVEHKKIAKAKKGDEVGLKVKEKVRSGYRVYKVE